MAKSTRCFLSLCERTSKALRKRKENTTNMERTRSWNIHSLSCIFWCNFSHFITYLRTRNKTPRVRARQIDHFCQQCIVFSFFSPRFFETTLELLVKKHFWRNFTPLSKQSITRFDDNLTETTFLNMPSRSYMHSIVPYVWCSTLHGNDINRKKQRNYKSTTTAQEHETQIHKQQRWNCTCAKNTYRNVHSILAILDF